MTAPPQSLQRILIAMCYRHSRITSADSALLQGALDRFDLIGDLWRAAHLRPEIAAAMRAADYPAIRDLAALLDSAEAMAAIETALNSTPSSPTMP